MSQPPVPPPPGVPPGWYPAGNVQRYWDGQTWTDQTAPLAEPPAGMLVPMAPPPAGPAAWQPPKTNHILHLLLTVLTCGLWSIVWGGTSIAHAGRRVDAQGRPIPMSKTARIVAATIGATVFIALAISGYREAQDHTTAVESACRQALQAQGLSPHMFSEQTAHSGDRWTVGEQVTTTTGATARYVCHVVWANGSASVADAGPG